MGPRAAVSCSMIALALACGARHDAPEIGHDCAALQTAARAGAACDPALGVLADALAERPDETACRAAVRELLAAPVPEPAIRSALVAPRPRDVGPLSEDELAAL